MAAHIMGGIKYILDHNAPYSKKGHLSICRSKSSSRIFLSSELKNTASCSLQWQMDIQQPSIRPVAGTLPGTT